MDDELLLVDGGQPQVLEMAARELRLRHGDFIVVPHGVSRLPSAASKQVSDQEKRLAMHAGHSETALMLALVALIWFYQMAYESRLRPVLRLGPVRVGLAASMLLYLSLCSTGGRAFIYFQF